MKVSKQKLLSNCGLVAIFLGIVFFTFGLFTLSHYGTNWDASTHLTRGQAYLNFLLHGEKDFSNRPEAVSYFQNPKSLGIEADIGLKNVPRRSTYEYDGRGFEFFMQHDGYGHPPLSDILTAGVNRLLFADLRIINDLDAYHVYGILLAAALVALVYYWTSKSYGKVAGVVAALALSTYPLFWAESHFNTEKDVPETAFWAFMFFCLWKGFKEKKKGWVLLSGLFFGLALGTKFNILFSVFAIVPWLIYRFFQKERGKELKLIPFGILAIAIGIAIFFATWPYLWADPLARVREVVSYYEDIGTTTIPDPRYLGPRGINFYPLIWIAYTTPVFILILSIVGSLVAVYKVVWKKDDTSLLFLLWLLVPIGRVVWPGTSIYGGIRQIMEYIPAVAILAGVGVQYFWNMSKSARQRWFLVVIGLLCFGSLVFRLYKIHPNENVYFNSLAGGLSGAREKDIPYWGFSFGNPYRQGVEWLNENVPQGGTVLLAYELRPNIPQLWLRQDLTIANPERSGYLRKGEYAITLTYRGSNKRSYYDGYLEKFLEPVYQVEVDGVAILKIWKNDEEHLKMPWVEVEDKTVALTKSPGRLLFDLGEMHNISRLEIDYSPLQCLELESGFDQISKDGENWERLPENLPDSWRIAVLGKQPRDGHFIEPYIGQEARYVELFLSPVDTCLMNVRDFHFYYLENL